MTAPTMIDDALAAAAHLREDADFNRSWTDGRRGQPHNTPAYKARRIEVAEERERWAAAIENLVRQQGLVTPNEARRHLCVPLIQEPPAVPLAELLEAAPRPVRSVITTDGGRR